MMARLRLVGLRGRVEKDVDYTRFEDIPDSDDDGRIPDLVGIRTGPSAAKRNRLVRLRGGSEEARGEEVYSTDTAERSGCEGEQGTTTGVCVLCS